jgi:hypothetical protein
MDDSVINAGFSPIIDHLPVENLELPEHNPDCQGKTRFRLWNYDQESAVTYLNPLTDESFAVVIATSQKFRSTPQGFLVGIVDDITPGMSARAMVDDFFENNSRSLTDLSTKMLVKPLPSGKQVILSVNTFSVGSDLHFKLWVVIQETRI